MNVKKKKRSLAKYKKDLWRHFTLYIKARDKYVCVTCGRKVEGQNAHGGHYMAKGACSLEYYFSEVNVHCQCAGCNLFLEGNRPAYRHFILQRYSEETLKDLETNYHKPVKWSEEDFKKKIEEYQARLAAL